MREYNDNMRSGIEQSNNKLSSMERSDGMRSEKEEVTCYFCEKTMGRDSGYRKLFGMNVCPVCSDKIAKVVEQILIDREVNKGVRKEVR